MAISLLLCVAVIAAALSPLCQASTVKLSSRPLNVSSLGHPNYLPTFVNTNVSAPPAMQDSCPDDIWENVIKTAVPKLPYLMMDGYDRSQTPSVVDTVVLESDNMRATCE